MDSKLLILGVIVVVILVLLFLFAWIVLLILRINGEQTDEQIKIIGEEQRRAELKQMKIDCQSACKCDSQLTEAGFCLNLVESSTGGKGKMDFSLDGFTDDFAEPIETAGLFAICEDRVYCSQLVSCRCGSTVLNMQGCFKILCDFWKGQGENAVEKMKEFFPEPNCSMTPEQEARHWHTIYKTAMQCTQ